MKDIIIKILEKTKQNTLIIDKINEIILKQDPEAEKLDVSIIDDLIEELNSEKTSNSTSITGMSTETMDRIKGNNVIPNVKITLVQSDKKLNQILLQIGKGTVSIKKNKTVDNLSYDISCEVKEEAKEEQETNSSLFEAGAFEPMEAKLFFKAKYTGLNTLANVQENYEVGYSVSGGEMSLDYSNKINSNTVFKDSVSIDNLNNSRAIFLNDYDETQLTPFLTQVGTRLLAINKNQMEKLGLKEDENPLIYSNPATTIIMLGLKVYKDAAETIENVSFSGQEVMANQVELLIQ